MGFVSSFFDEMVWKFFYTFCKIVILKNFPTGFQKKGINKRLPTPLCACILP